MSVTILNTPTVNRNGFDSNWVSAHSPILFEVTNNLFPNNTEDTIYISNLFTDFNGFLEVNLTEDVDFIPQELIKITNANISTYNNTFRILRTNGSRKIVLDISFDTALQGQCNIQKAYQNYEIAADVFAGLPTNHKWQSLKPQKYIGSLPATPDENNNVIINIKDYVLEQIETKNDYQLASLPNDINLWTGFRVGFKEIYSDFVGLVEFRYALNSYEDVDGNAAIQVTLNAGYQIGDYIKLDGLNIESENRRFRITNILDGTFPNNALYVLDTPYVGTVVINSGETAQKFDTTLIRFETGSLFNGVQYYAVNAKEGENLNLFVNQLLNNNLAQNTTVFDKLYFNRDQQIDLSYIIDKDLLNRVNDVELIAVQRKAYDINNALLDESYVYPDDENEGVYRIGINDTTPIPERPLISFNTSKKGFILVVVQNTDIGRWEVDGVIFNGNTLNLNVQPGSICQYFAPDQANVTTILLQECGIDGGQVLNLSAFTNLQEFGAVNQDFRLSVGSWITNPNVIINTVNSIRTRESYNFTQDQLIIQAGGTLTESGGSYIGNPGITSPNRKWFVGTITFDLSVTGDQITYEKFLALTTVDGGTGWDITTIKTLCQKNIDFLLQKGVQETAYYTIPTDYRTDRPSGSNVLVSIDDSELEPNTLDFVLLTPDGLFITNNFLLIDSQLQNLDRTGYILRVSGTPINDTANITLVISDFPTQTDICNSTNFSKRFGKSFFDLYFEGIEANTGVIESWEDVATPLYLLTPSLNVNKPTLLLDNKTARFSGLDNSIIFRGNKNNFNFLHSSSNGYTLFFAADLSVLLGSEAFATIFSTSDGASNEIGLTINNEQRNVFTATFTPGLAIAITNGTNSIPYSSYRNHPRFVSNVVEGMAVYKMVFPSSGGDIEVYYNNTLAFTLPLLGSLNTGDSSARLTLGKPEIGNNNGNFGDIADVVIIDSNSILTPLEVQNTLALKNIDQCNKIINFQVTRNDVVPNGETVNFEFTRDLTYNGIFNTGIVDIDNSGIEGTILIDLYSDNTKNTMLASGLSDINTWFTDNQSTSTTGLVLELTARPTATKRNVAVTIIDYADADSPCGFVIQSGRFQVESNDPNEVTVYSTRTGDYDYTLRNLSTGISVTGTASFNPPIINIGVAQGNYQHTITGLVSGTKYSLQIGLSEEILFWSMFDFELTANDQHLFSSSVADYLNKTDINYFEKPKTFPQVYINGGVYDYSKPNMPNSINKVTNILDREERLRWCYSGNLSGRVGFIINIGVTPYQVGSKQRIKCFYNPTTFTGVGSNTHSICGTGIGSNGLAQMFLNSNGTLNIWNGGGGGGDFVTTTIALSENTFHSIELTTEIIQFESSLGAGNGIVEHVISITNLSTSTTQTETLTNNSLSQRNSNSFFTIGRNADSSLYGKIYGVELLYAQNGVDFIQQLNAPCQEESGTISYNTVPNSNNGLEFVDITHLQDNDVTYSDANNRGYNLDGSVVVPLLDDLSSAANGGIIQYLGVYVPYAQIEGSPAAIFTATATIAFIRLDSAGFPRPTDVTINKSDRVAAGTYNSATGVFTFSNGGEVYSFDLTYAGSTFEGYVSSNAGGFLIFKQGAIAHAGQVTFGQISWGTQDLHHFNQAKGANRYRGILNKLLLNSTISVDKAVFVELDFFWLQDNVARKWFDRGASLLFALSGSAGGGTGDGIIQFSGDGRLSFVSFTGATLAISNAGTAISTVVNQGLRGKKVTVRLSRADASNTLDVTWYETETELGVDNPFNSYSVDLTTGGNNTGNFQLRQFFGYFNKGASVRRYTDGTFATVTEQWDFNETTGLWETITGSFTISSQDVRDGFLPSALDANGNSTGFDVLGNPLPENYSNRLFDFGNNLVWQQTTGEVTETFNQLPPPNTSDEKADEYTIDGLSSKEDIIYISGGATTNQNNEILKYTVAKSLDNLTKKIKRN